ncbi:hypothetical protein EMIHUDRAFT_457692 [Emiliania huxleyi CCMP1516]|uniref:Uncharacterized protein n=2 Tax=Emiliania huxleyi TaxID=2903 RepID=A0A0D3JMQ3_EMIH1|nr:hypothetical protein EMIHUDRAFT_457692 [Emiliania huxleyi CCMP1516]EOD24788.1 hypothetical protein EMIHUDRAFT_457692 [Emiliania huxleyi CCMP1516]|eukprot:XP_005777217.1 hypothetical protein EMIHUDRAFT_457692 [Emiliania huxleyi CCMP1516]
MKIFFQRMLLQLPAAAGLPALLPALLLRPTPAPSRAAPPCAAAAADWSRLVEGAPREANLAALEELSAAGAASLWKSAKVSPRPVSLGELSRTTKIPEAALDPTATEYSLQDIQDTFVKVVVGCTVGAVAWAAGSDALGLDAGLRFTGTYLLAGVPIGILAIGSTAPGILFCQRAFKKATADEEARRGALQRVVVYDEELAQQPGVFVSADQISSLAVVAVSGLIAEASAYGKALGANADLKLLNEILLRCQPPIPAGKQQELSHMTARPSPITEPIGHDADTTRYAALMAWSILQKHERALEAIAAALEEGEGAGLATCLEAAEAAEAGRDEVERAAADARAEALARETPQERAAHTPTERAAREREEMAARGRS